MRKQTVGPRCLPLGPPQLASEPSLLFVHLGQTQSDQAYTPGAGEGVLP